LSKSGALDEAVPFIVAELLVKKRKIRVVEWNQRREKISGSFTSKDIT
jgi:hypothetical protein